ncbi:hypothetical protein [Streptomyces sp. SAS_270]|uniref:hypothetical protein n=1 Tax=Streptomyces sp. SAS_270 TaxID=3412748 RepID=UPI00403D00BF
MSEKNNERPDDRPRPPALLDQAGRIVATVGVVPLSLALDVIRGMSARTHIKERHVAELLVDWASSGRLPADLHSELRRQLEERRERIRRPGVVTAEATPQG